MECEHPRPNSENELFVMDAPGPPGRVSCATLGRQQAEVRQDPLLQAIVDGMPDMVLMLNLQRQIVLANRSALRLLAALSPRVIGRRPGEALDCVHAAEGPDGCGTADHCMTCGAVQAIVESAAKHCQVTRECRIRLRGDSPSVALDLQVTATPIEVGEEFYILCAIRDISDQKRLAVLTRLFFHDVLNTAGASARTA
jgi:PAS domain-containing protein